ncbi:MAG: DNA polymerase III subunit beta [Candidatus Dojkabacteria bacterium]|jgi:DNA polymerase-3 subunit beta
MKFSCNQDTFSKYLNIVSRVVATKSGLPILSNVSFESKDGKLILKTTDLELSITTWIGADIKEDGVVTVPAKQLAEFVNSIPEEKVDIEVEKQNFNISTENNSASFNTMPSEDFPNIPTIGKDNSIVRIKKEDLVTAIERVAFATATDDIKPVLTGVKIEIEDGVIHFIATDGLRLSRQSVNIEKGATKKNFLVPVRALLELSYIVSSLDTDEEWINIYTIDDKNQVLFRFADVDLISRLIDGEFPEYRQIIPTGYKTKCMIQKNDFVNSIKIINIIARSVLGNKMILDISSTAGKISLSAVQSDLGKNESNMSCKIEGDDIKIAFSAKLLNDVLTHIDNEDIVFECSESTRPGVFKIDGDDNFIHLVMPMML